MSKPDLVVKSASLGVKIQKLRASHLMILYICQCAAGSVDGEKTCGLLFLWK
jgi:hypothetical protein